MLSTGDVSKLLGVTAQTVINWLEQGEIPFHRIGNGRRKIHGRDIIAFLRKKNIPQQDLDPVMLERAHQEAHIADSFNHPVLVMVNRDGYVVGWNEGASSFFGIRPVEVLGKPLANVPGLVEGPGQSMEHFVLNSWHAPFTECQVSHVLSGKRKVRTHLVISRYYGRTTSTGGFVLSFTSLS